MTRTWLVRLGIVAAIAALFALVVSRTEWVDEEQPRPARGAAAEDGNYALAQLVRHFGATFEHHRNLETLPPRDATLLLETGLWDLFPERREQLHRWVQAGGHLVVPVGITGNRQALHTWIPVLAYDPVEADARRRRLAARLAASAPESASRPASAGADAVDDDDEDDEDDEDEDGDAGRTKPSGGDVAPSPRIPATRTPLVAPAASGAASAAIPATGSEAASAALRRSAVRDECHEIVEPADMPSALPGHRRFRACRLYVAPLWPDRATPQWSLESGGSRVALRMPVGRGTVTVSSLVAVDNNEELVRDDHALVLAALLQLHPGQVVWDVDDESQPVLAVWLWEHARPAILLGTLALLAWLWRRLVRFGPRVAEPEAARRSIGEQIAGIGAFLRHHEPAALQRAERRALEDLARRRLADFDTLDDAERARAIAEATRTDAATLLAAMRPGPLSSPTQWLAAAATLEQARRALRTAASPPPP